MVMMIYDVIIIGGGASGIMAALSASNFTDKILIIEKNNRIGKKILVTGNGRCNFTNITMKNTDYNNPEFVKDVFEQFDVHDTIDYFDSLGIVAKIEDEGKTYPLSEQASSFLDVFLYELNKKKINIVLEQNVSSVSNAKDIFSVRTDTNQLYKGKTVILATGGKSMPLTGSNGSGLDIASNLGHRIINTFPALVKLKLDSPYLKQLAGLKINSQVDLLLGEETIQSEYGDILFANYGISGPTILELSRKANELLKINKEVFLRIILIQSISKQKIMERLDRFLDREISQALIGLVHKRLINVLIKEAGIEKNNLLVKDIPKEQIYRLIDLFYDWRLVVKGSLGFEESQVTAGGIDVSEVSSKTLESKLVSDLFFTGEVLDIDGRCGGYNLQWAWSSGYLAGKYASERALK
jgi:predicted Rossmann fold flavoprotein